MDKQSDEHSAPDSLVAISEWKLPASTVRRTLIEAFRHGLNQLRIGRLSTDQVFDNLPPVSPLSDAQQSRLAPEPDWLEDSLGLQANLLERWKTSPDWQPFSAIVAPPGSGVPEQLMAMADRRGWQVIVPPNDLLMTDAQAIDWWQAIDFSEPWVIPELSHFWLRHRSGLALVRQLLIRLARGDVSAGVFGCNSWCWAFWNHCLPGLHFSVLTPAAMDADRLGRWLSALAKVTLRENLQIRTTDAGLWVLPQDEERSGPQDGTYLRDLAAMSRGIPTVALALWRRALHLTPDHVDDDPEQNTGTECSDSAQGTCDGWVAPLDSLKLPALPPQPPSRSPMLILHALLLHDGLGDDKLIQVTGLPPAGVGLALNTLRRFELIARGDRGWVVSPVAYPGVRRQLQSDGFPIDGF